MMVEKTGDEHTEHPIDKEALFMQLLKELAEEKGKEIEEFIESFHQMRAKRLERQKD